MVKWGPILALIVCVPQAQADDNEELRNALSGAGQSVYQYVRDRRAAQQPNLHGKILHPVWPVQTGQAREFRKLDETEKRLLEDVKQKVKDLKEKYRYETYLRKDPELRSATDKILAMTDRFLNEKDPNVAAQMLPYVHFPIVVYLQHADRREDAEGYVAYMTALHKFTAERSKQKLDI